ncbi:VirB4 family type IV secretion system protein [Anaeromicropila populeti]|uniref:TraG P-loop domain-containing protein n=1 Tax=Anaeromicropila populeti TaxID=37658 RepID=A0A1I6JFY6_9FIRM|nr:hypothetical protein [Anaeromicropila populeti]SFR77882.1 hypothetical protein SAMN05661086_01652 [Anaeromicropila populeti]
MNLKKSNIRKGEEINNALLNAVSPVGLFFGRNRMEVGENVGRVYGIIHYPMDIAYGWLSKLTNIPGTIASFVFTPMESGEFIEALNKNISRHRAIEKEAQDALTRDRAKKAADDGEKLMIQIDQHGEAVGTLSMSILAISPEEEKLTKVCRKTTSSCLASKIKVRMLTDLQKNGFRQISPFYTIDQDVQQITERIAPLSAVAGGFPNASSGLNDESGFYMAVDGAGGLMFLNLWLRKNDRTCSDILVTGIKGQGKSTAVKHIALNEYMLGTRIIFIDPEAEYGEECRKLQGDWINAGGGIGGRINPLQIAAIPREENDKVYTDEGNGMGDLALYIKHLEIFFSLYLPSLTDMDRAVLKDSLIELYNQFRIYWTTDISKLCPEDFPILSDLYNLLKSKADKEEAVRKDGDVNYYKKLSLLLKDAAEGADSILWNGKTTLHAESRCVCLDTSALQGSSDNVKRAQYFLINSWTWQQMSRDRTERVMTFYDEAYLMIDPNIPQSLVFLRNCMKRSRKYEAAMVIISHSVNDFLSPEVKMYGQALVDEPCYKIMFGTDGKNLMETKELYNLTNAEENLLSSKQKKHALMMIGNKRMHVKFDIPEYELEYFGKAGGR